MPADGLEPST